MSPSRVDLARKRRRAVPPRGMLYPLDAIYQRAGMTAPVAKRITAARIPPPCHDLLVSADGMTLTLEQHVGGKILVRVLSSFSLGRSYFRRVLLVAETTGRPVAMCAVRLELDAFSRAVRARILAERVPLGSILSDAGVEYRSSPTSFFLVTPTAEMMAFFWMRESRPFYGRQTQVTVPDHYIGDIVEILPTV